MLTFGRQQQQQQQQQQHQYMTTTGLLLLRDASSRMDGYGIRLPEQYSATFSQVTNSIEPALLFDFKTTVCSLDKIVRALHKKFGIKAILAIKRQASSSNDRIRLEVLFGSAASRKQALEAGLVVNGVLLRPKPMVYLQRGYLVLRVSNLPVESPEAAELRIHHALENDLSAKNIMMEYLQLHTTQSIYNSTATVVLSIPCRSNMKKLAEETRILFRDSPGLPILDHVALCYAFCSRCKALDDHQESDCESIAIARGKRLSAEYTAMEEKDSIVRCLTRWYM
ncbi:hypothetical protein BCR43DRAFT_488988 [Syncephalastrum racemosum]|uniref:Uncharacterized protein n=1 Tax=Syncephalastrum racemosum TaxID=13706 RepID=A0A1X2HJI0_SYNRA|nr:hypothetical protein BCR43DRAFT_488988 [Syncephalastrum racemosum]